MAYPFQKNGTYPVPEPTLRPAAAAYRRIRRRFMRAIPETLRRGRDAFLSRPRRIGGTPRSRRVLFEPLEPRLLLSADLSFTALTASDLTLRVQDVEGTQHLQIVLADETAPGGEIIVTSQDLSLTNTATISLRYSQQDLDSAGITDPNYLWIYQLQTKNPYLYAPLSQISSTHDPNSRILEADIDHFSLYIVGFSTSQDPDPGNPGQPQPLFKTGGGCFISVL